MDFGLVGRAIPIDGDSMTQQSAISIADKINQTVVVMLDIPPLFKSLSTTATPVSEL